MHCLLPSYCSQYYSVFWYPIMILTFLVIPLLVFTVIRLTMTGGARAVIVQWRLLVMIAYSVATYCLFSAFHLSLEIHTDTYKKTMADYIACVSINGSDKGCDFKKRPSFKLQLAFFMMWEMTGLVSHSVSPTTHLIPSCRCMR